MASLELSAPSEQATVIFVRRSRTGGEVRFMAVDQNGEFVARLDGPSHCVIHVDPGEYDFYVLAENADMISATVEAGRAYIIETRVQIGASRAQVTAEAVRRDTVRFDAALQWIEDTPTVAHRPRRARAWVSGHEQDISERIASLQSDLSDHSADWRAAHTLRREDGYTADEFRSGSFPMPEASRGAAAGNGDSHGGASQTRL